MFLRALQWATNSSPNIFYRVSISEFEKIPGNPLAYWISGTLRSVFKSYPKYSEYFFSDGLTKTGDNDKYLRFHWEVSYRDAVNQDRFRICVKGGEARNYFGNLDILVDWTPKSRDHYKKDLVARITPEYLWSASGISWTKISSRGPTFRWFGNGMIAETGGPAIFCKKEIDQKVFWQGLGFLTSKVCWHLLTSLNPTLNFQTTDVLSLPIVFGKTESIPNLTRDALEIEKYDWDLSETSYFFQRFALISNLINSESLAIAYELLRQEWFLNTRKLVEIERTKNSIFINTLGLQTELNPDVSLDEITLTCNPHYRYGGNKSDAELEALLRADTMREFISYAVGCMFGRYSLDKPGLLLANQGETLADYLRQVPEPRFLPDEDNAIPILDGDWFGDDITERFKKFLRLTFGDEHFSENLAFIEEAIGRDVRSYFLKEFYAEHLKMYKKRPIYWLFSSPKGSFNVLIYMHRYTPDTLSVILNRYLREFRAKLEARRAFQEQVSISASANPREKTAALKEIDKLNKTLEEMRVYERETLFPLAAQRIAIDLDDGVKVNYAKFGNALAKIPGL